VSETMDAELDDTGQVLPLVPVAWSIAMLSLPLAVSRDCCAQAEWFKALHTNRAHLLNAMTLYADAGRDFEWSKMAIGPARQQSSCSRPLAIRPSTPQGDVKTTAGPLLNRACQNQNPYP
jgi:hypothetical protein